MKCRKFVCGVIAALLLLTVLPLAVPIATGATEEDVFKSGSCGEAVTWVLTNSGELIISGTGEMQDYAASSGNPLATPTWRNYSKRVKKVVIQDGVTSIGDYALSALNQVTSVTIADSVTRIGEGAFSGMAEITKLTLPSGVTEIGAYAFSKCKKLTKLNIPSGVTRIEKSTFGSCRALKSVTLPKGLTYIGYEAFEAAGISSIQIPSSVTEIGSRAFAGCDSLKKVVIPEGVTKLGNEVFDTAYFITSITLPETLVEMGRRVFMGCGNLGSITIPASVKYMDGTLEGYSGSKIKYLGHAPTGGANFAVNTVTISYPSSAKSWTEGVKSEFTGYVVWSPYKTSKVFPEILAEGSCGEQVTWQIREDWTLVISGTGAMDALTEENSWHKYAERIRTVVIEQGVTSIGANAFYKHVNLESVSIPDSVTVIGADAFNNASNNLKRIVIPAGVKTIGWNAFQGCGALEEIIFQGDAPEIGKTAFQSVTATAYYPADNATWTEDVRVDYNGELTWLPDSELEMIPLESGSCGEDATWTWYTNGLLQISGTGAMSDYTEQNPAPWQAYSSQIQNIQILSGITHVGSNAFRGCVGVTEVSIPDTVQTLGDYALRDCTALSQIVLPDSVKTVGVGVLAGCKALQQVTLSAGLTAISDGMLEGCAALTAISIPESVQSIGNSAFAGCTGLKTVTVPQGVTKIAGNVFTGCAALENVVFLGNAPTIDSAAFTEVVANVFYDTGTKGWSSVAGKNYGGTLFWCGLQEPDPQVIARTAGRSGAAVVWRIVDGTLTVSGSGEMVYADMAPWGPERENIQKVVIEKGVTNIGENAFYGCRNLTSVSIADTVTTIGGAAFTDCSALTSVTIPDGVTEIGPAAFMGCTKLSSVSIADSVREIGSNAFSECDSLVKVTLPENLRSIENNLFSGCDNLTTVNIPYGAAYVGYSAFAGCKKLSSIHIPGTVAYLGDYAFSSCTSLKTVRFGGNAPEFKGNFPFHSVTATCYYPAGNPTWTPEAMSTFNAQLTWVAYNGGDTVGPMGDASGDGIVDSYDATLILKYDVGMISRSDMSAAYLDVSGDGAVNSYDATLILQYDVGMITEFPAA